MTGWHLGTFLLIVFLTHGCNARGTSNLPWSVRMADSFMGRHPDSIFYTADPKSSRWNYEQGLILEAMDQMWRGTGQEKYRSYIQKNIDRFVQEDGSIRTYEDTSYNLDNIAQGRMLLMLYAQTREEKYRIAAVTLRTQLEHQPRTADGGFWHKKIYPFQMWLDGVYMAEPFYAEFAGMFNQPAAFDDVVHQITLIERHTRDPKTGLLSHGWDERRVQRWADSLTGRSPSFWGRAMGWYAMALVDVLDYLPGEHPGRPEIIAILRRLSSALLNYRDPKTGLWYQVVDQAGRAGNYLEASASCMFVYAFAKGANKGYLEPRLFSVAHESFSGIVKEMITEDRDGGLSIHHGCQVSGLGGNPYRDGSYEYYIGEPQRTNDFKAVGPFMLAALEIEKGSARSGKK